MIYLSPPSTAPVKALMQAGGLGTITTPAQGNVLPAGVYWGADNGCFGAGYPGDDAWLRWLAALPYDRSMCLWATAPDVVGDAAATLERSTPHLPNIRALGYPAAFVAQDGIEMNRLPWDAFDVLFIGGGDDFKLGRLPGATPTELTRQARLRGKWVHMGRVNSHRRWSYAEHIGCDSVDGTFLKFGPNVNLPRLQRWTAQTAFSYEEDAS